MLHRIHSSAACDTVCYPLSGLVAVTAVSGAFVAGLDAGHAYNTFPLMDGRIVPAEYWDPYSIGWLDNSFEHTAAVQFHHRVLALSTLGCVTALWAATRRITGLPARTATLLHGMLGMTYTQVRVCRRPARRKQDIPLPWLGRVEDDVSELDTSGQGLPWQALSVRGCRSCVVCGSALVHRRASCHIHRSIHSAASCIYLL